MVNFEFRISNEEFRKQLRRIALLSFFILNSKFAILNSLANELTVDRRTLTLTDSFAQLDNVRLPLQNLVIDGGPSTSSEFQWINGQSFRRKILRWTAHAR